MKIFLALLIFCTTCGAGADVIKLRADLWCPYTCDPSAALPGFMVEMAKEIFSKKGHKINYSLMNWSRAISDVKSGKYDGLIGASKNELSGFDIPLVAAGTNQNYFWALKDSTWSYSDESSLNGIKVGVVNAYSYGDEIDVSLAKKNSSFVKVAGDNPLQRLIQMTETRRLTTFIENPTVLLYTLGRLKKEAGLFKAVSKNIANDPDLFIAFGPANAKSKLYSQIMDEGIVELRKSGRLKIILQKYGLSDWK